MEGELQFCALLGQPISPLNGGRDPANSISINHLLDCPHEVRSIAHHHIMQAEPLFQRATELLIASSDQNQEEHVLAGPIGRRTFPVEATQVGVVVARVARPDTGPGMVRALLLCLKSNCGSSVLSSRTLLASCRVNT